MKPGNKGISTIRAIVVIWCFFSIQVAQAAVREYWIAAEQVTWNYAPLGKNVIKPDAGLGVWGQTLSYPKYRYIGYSDGSYSKPLPQPSWMGILGPQMRAVVGDTIKVHFLNKTDRPLSIHPHGVLYDKNNEGADGSGEGASVGPNKSYTYTWIADEAAGPPSDARPPRGARLQASGRVARSRGARRSKRPCQGQPRAPASLRRRSRGCGARV